MVVHHAAHVGVATHRERVERRDVVNGCLAPQASVGRDTGRPGLRLQTGRTRSRSGSCADSFRAASCRHTLDRREEHVGRGAHEVDERFGFVLVEPPGDRAVHQRLERPRRRRVERVVEITSSLTALDELQEPRLGLVARSLRDDALVEAELDARDLAEHAAEERPLSLDRRGPCPRRAAERDRQSVWPRRRALRRAEAEPFEHGLGERFDEGVLRAEIVEYRCPATFAASAMSAIVTSSKPCSANRPPAMSSTRRRGSVRGSAVIGPESKTTWTRVQDLISGVVAAVQASLVV